MCNDVRYLLATLTRYILHLYLYIIHITYTYIISIYAYMCTIFDIMQIPVSNLSVFRSPPWIRSHPEKREQWSRLSALQTLQDMCTCHMSDRPSRTNAGCRPCQLPHYIHYIDMTDMTLNVNQLIHLRPSGHLYEFSAAARPRQPEAQPCLTQAADIHPLTSTHIKH